MQLKKVKLGEISFKDGVSKTNKPYTMVFIKVGDKSASMYCDTKYGQKDLEKAQSWNVGDTVLLGFEKSGEYLNFKIPGKTDLLEARVEELEKAVFGEKK